MTTPAVFNAQAAYDSCVGATKKITSEEKLEAIMKLVATKHPRYIVLGRPAKANGFVATLRIYPKGDETSKKAESMV